MVQFAAAAPYVIGGLLLISGAGAISAAAQNSLPGDPLYGIKVNVNENVRQGLAMSPEADAKVSADLALRRLEEAEALAKLDVLSPEDRVRLEAQFADLANQTEESASVVAETDSAAAAEITENFNTDLQGHACVLAALYGNADAEQKAEIQSLGASVLGQQEDTTHLTSAFLRNAEGVVPSADVANGLLVDVQNQIDDLRARINDQRLELGTDAAADALAQLELAEQLLESGEASLAADAFGDAFILFSAASNTATQADTFVDVMLEDESAGIDAGIDGGADADANVDTDSGADAGVDTGADGDAGVDTDVDLDLDDNGIIDVNIP